MTPALRKLREWWRRDWDTAVYFAVVTATLAYAVWVMWTIYRLGWPR